MSGSVGSAPLSPMYVVSKTLPGYAPPGKSGGKAKMRRSNRPAAISRAGFFPWIAVSLSLGISLWFIWPLKMAAVRWTLLIFSLLVALAFARFVTGRAEQDRLNWHIADALRLVCFAGVLTGLGFGLMAARSAYVEAPVLGWRYYGPIEGRLVNIDRSARDRIRLTLDQVVLEDMAPEKTPERVRLSLMGEAAETIPLLGQYIQITGHLGPPPGPAAPNSFDFRRHAWFSQLGAIGYARLPAAVLSSPDGKKWWMHRMRMRISQIIQARIGGQEGAVAAALMTGDRSGIFEATNETMRASNLYHIISISGLHMGMLAGFIYAAFRYFIVLWQVFGFLPKAPAHKISAAIAICAAGAYLWLSGGGVATERAFIMVAVMLLAILADRRAVSLRTVAMAATVILIYSPESVASPGFQMSFAATIALILSYGPWVRLSRHFTFWLRPVIMLMFTSLIAGFATAPIAAAHFNQLVHYGLVANLLVVPVMGTLVMPAGVIAALLAPFGLAAPALWVMGAGTAWMLKVAEFIAGLDGAVTMIPQPHPMVLPAMCFAAALMVLCWRPGPFLRLTVQRMGVYAGVAVVIVALAMWLNVSRPLLLIASEGEAVGLMTDQGRVLSKPAGGSFSVKTWLREDGDISTQIESAEKPGWTGDRRDRQADLPQDWKVLHFTGKGSGARAAAACLPGRIVVATERTGLRRHQQKCVLFDLYSLRWSGAVAIDFDEKGPQITTVESAHHSPGGG